jgi:hypothetical protein
MPVRATGSGTLMLGPPAHLTMMVELADAEAKVRRPCSPPTPMDLRDHQELIRVANLADSVLVALRQAARGRYESERALASFLSADGVAYTAADLGPGARLVGRRWEARASSGEAERATTGMVAHSSRSARVEFTRARCEAGDHGGFRCPRDRTGAQQWAHPAIAAARARLQLSVPTDSPGRNSNALPGGEDLGRHEPGHPRGSCCNVP